MKVFLALALTFYQIPKCYSQQFFGGINSSCYIDNFPTDIFGSVNGGICWKHFSSALEFTNRMGFRETSFQLLGIKERVHMRPTDKMFNFFFELQGSTQVSGKGQGTAIDPTFFNHIEEYSSEYKGDRFLRANFQGSANLGFAISVKGFQLYGSYGLSKRYWSSYKIYDESMITRKGTYHGHLWTIGLNYYFDIKRKQE